MKNQKENPGAVNAGAIDNLVVDSLKASKTGRISQPVSPNYKALAIEGVCLEMLADYRLFSELERSRLFSIGAAAALGSVPAGHDELFVAAAYCRAIRARDGAA